LLHLESELEDDASQSSFESKSDDESLPDDADSSLDDATSQSSVESRRMAPAEKCFEMPSHSSSPSDNQTLSLLQGLCSLLETRVNPLLIPEQASSYPRLARLLEYVQLLPTPPDRLEFVPIPGSGPTPFLFNVTESGATAAAFVALCDPAQKRPPGETRRRMLTEIRFLSDRFLKFNGFVNEQKISIGSLDDLAARPSGSSSSTTGSFDSFALLQRFRQQTAAAFRAAFSQFGSCAHRESIKHRIRLQLPGWEAVSDCHSTDSTRNLPVQLFFTRCQREDWQLEDRQCEDWQLASMYFLR
jgi:hypothetical protein